MLVSGSEWELERLPSYMEVCKYDMEHINNSSVTRNIKKDSQPCESL